MNRPGECTDLLWRAHQYVSGDLSDAERLAFEELLASDEAACNALAEAVLLSEAVAASEWEATRSVRPLPAAAPGPSHRWTAVAIAAAVLVLVVMWSKPTHDDPENMAGVSPPAAPSRENGSVLSVWVSLNEAPDATGELLAGEAGREDFAHEGPSDVPEWMITALVSSTPILDELESTLPGPDGPRQEPL